MDSNGAPANSTIRQAVYDHIISPDDRQQRLAPIGAILIVSTAEPISVAISADVMIEDDTTIEEVTAAYKAALLAYFEEAKAESCIRWTRIGSVLSETPGVIDYSNLLLNGAEDNIAITVDDYPTITTLELGEET